MHGGISCTFVTQVRLHAQSRTYIGGWFPDCARPPFACTLSLPHTCSG